jgi:hypothetical protein
MNPEPFARMLIFEACKHNLSYEWQKSIFERRYAGRLFKDDLFPQPPTVLFRLEMQVIEAQQRIERLQGDGVAA